jgi:hypothetical protein
LEQGGALAGRTPAAVGAIGLRVLAEPAQIVFKVVPRDVARMRVRDQRRPFLTRQPLVEEPRVGRMALPAAPEEERARIAGIVEDPQRA